MRVTCVSTSAGLLTNAQGQVMHQRRHPIPGLYAAGELVGGLFYQNYPGGTGLLNGERARRSIDEPSAEAPAHSGDLAL